MKPFWMCFTVNFNGFMCTMDFCVWFMCTTVMLPIIFSGERCLFTTFYRKERGLKVWKRFAHLSSCQKSDENCSQQNIHCQQGDSFRHVKNEQESYSAVIGLEIHAQINSESKLFSGAQNIFMAPPNSMVSNFDASIPGTLPVINKECVKLAVQSALSLNCSVNTKSYFDRKHYFYADMPQGYQITQKRRPIAMDGIFYYPSLDGNHLKCVQIQQVQLEQDSGKSMEDYSGSNTLIDLNRANVGLIEIVTAPDLTNATDACSFTKELQMTLRTIGACGGKMAEGQFRVDVNISLHKPGEPLGVRTEVKNISGIKSLRKAIDFEIRRQSFVLQRGLVLEEETRAFDDVSEETVPMREKEVKQDYRFMPEPNLPPLRLYTNETIHNQRHASDVINIDDIKRDLPILPGKMRSLLIAKYNLNFKQVTFLLDRDMAQYYYDVMENDPQLVPLAVFNWMRIKLVEMQSKRGLHITDCPVSAEQLAELLGMERDHLIKHMTSRKAFELALDDERSPVQIVKDNNWILIDDTSLISSICELSIKELKREKGNSFTSLSLNKRSKMVVTHVVESNDKVHRNLVKSIAEDLMRDEQET